MYEQLYQEWIEALESGRYTPAIHSLRVENKFCCLGVLCDVYDQARWVTQDDRYYYCGSAGVLPAQLIEELNLRSELGCFKIDDLSPNLQHEMQRYKFRYPDYCSLAELNDRDPDPFPLIAKILRERPKSLFKQ